MKGSSSQKSSEEKGNKVDTKIGEAKGFIEDEQQWLVTGSLHEPAEFTSDEDQKKFESRIKTPPGVREQDRLRPSIFISLKWHLVTLKIKIRMATTTLARWMWFVDIVVGKGLEQRSKAISQAQIRRSCLILEASPAATGCANQSIKNYNLPAQLEHMYTSDDSQSMFFRADSWNINNSMSMCSLKVKYGWGGRAPSKRWNQR